MKRSQIATTTLKTCQKRLGGCGAQFTPFKTTQLACGFDCAEAMGKIKAAKIARQAQLEDRRLTRAELEKRKTPPKLKAEAQESMNRYVRLRDNGKGCFVCHDLLILGGIGGGFDAGHIRSRSQADHLRYDIRNVHGQCKPCNAVGSTKDHVMREAAARLLGVEEADALYADNSIHHWTREELREIRDKYRLKSRELERQLRDNA